MAISSSTEWDVRPTGDDSNGGGFDTASSGTNYYEQDSPQVTYTDLVIDATTNTKVTSAGTPFTSLHVGNVINITSGTGFTVQRVQVVSVTSNVATCDKSLGTLSSTGGNGKLGGALATPDPIASVAFHGNTIHVKNGTYTRTTTLALANNVNVIGYQTTHLDFGTAPLITTATNSTPLISTGSAVSLQNLSLSNTAGTRSVGFKSSGTGAVLNVDRCTFDGFSWAIIADNSVANAGYVHVSASEIKNCTSGGVGVWYNLTAWDCYIHDNTGTALNVTSSQGSVFEAVGCILAKNTKGMVSVDGVYVRSKNNTIALNTSHGIDLTSISGNQGQPYLSIENTILYGNGGWGIDHGSSTYGLLVSTNRSNAYGSNTSGDVTHFTKSPSDVTLTASPFTNSGAGDYSLNPTAGGGALCKGAGYPGAFQGGTSAGSADIGAVQSSGGGGGGGVTNYGFIG